MLRAMGVTEAAWNWCAVGRVYYIGLHFNNWRMFEF